MAIRLVEGWTEPIDYIIQADDEAVDLSGKTVDLIAYANGRTLKTMSGTLEIINSPLGKVKFTPLAGDILASESPYYVRIKVLDDGYFVPSEDPEQWIVSK